MREKCRLIVQESSGALDKRVFVVARVERAEGHWEELTRCEWDPRVRGSLYHAVSAVLRAIDAEWRAELPIICEIVWRHPRDDETPPF